MPRHAVCFPNQKRDVRDPTPQNVGQSLAQSEFRWSFHLRDLFRRFAHSAAERMGSSWAFIGSLGVIVVWAATGPLFGFSDTWQLIINTSTTIVTFLMVFLIQNTQNRDAMAIHLKLNELLRAVDAARTGLVDLENLSDERLAALKQEFTVLSRDNCDGSG